MSEESSIWKFSEGGSDPLVSILEIIGHWTPFPARIRIPDASHPKFGILEIMDLYRIYLKEEYPVLLVEQTGNYGKIDYFAVFQTSYMEFNFIFSFQDRSVHRESIGGYRAWKFVDSKNGWAKRKSAFEFWCREEEILEEKKWQWWIEVDDPRIKGLKGQ